ncbi:type VI secretion protein IcmF/TssM N-terminal domain-containing protein [Malonomonas rubra]|uniref:type VI secretion protein IcmF/TssM N-terminal domain-containing protein n=1 Tax=Malonomonas rubra TaxID=57040 RepID=UPI0026F12CCB|nr:type VI secretion protein IcmF/TssM N-terminal domain-containing protein [Malonomonas rubra]
MVAKIFKILLIVTGISLVLLLAVMLIIALGWYGFFILLAIVGFIISGLFFRKIWMRRREQKFVNQIVEQDELQQANLSAPERQQRQELQERWKEAIGTLKRSHLKKLGNPLYVLPWYMVIGESGSGKTTAITSAKLSSPFAEAPRVSGLSGTKNCDWWFFDHSVILDTAGRYAIPVDEGRDKDEWLKFLRLLVKYRRKESLNGLIVSLPADKLLSADSVAIEDDAHSIRMRIQELMLALGVKFPVYLLVTKCDLIQGMTQFCDQLPESAQKQAMGYLNQGLDEATDKLVGLAVNSIVDRLRNLRLLLIHEHKKSQIAPELLLFPDEFAKLRSGLETFVRAAFKETPYQENPIIRGLYFSSGCQEGTPYSHFLNKLGLISSKDVLPGTSKGLFLHDFFSRILPADRAIFAPTGRALEWNRLTRNYGLAAWLLLGVAFSGLLAFSFINNITALQSVSNDYIQGPEFRDELLSDLGSLDALRKEIEKLESKNSDWLVPRFGLSQSLQAEERMKKRYCDKFNRYLLTPFDQTLRSEISNFYELTPAEDIGNYVIHLLRRITQLKDRLDDPTAASEDLPLIPVKELNLDRTTDMPAEVSAKMPELYRSYLLWSQNGERMFTEKEHLNDLLQSILWHKGGNLNWLVAWANAQESLPRITLVDFWPGENTLDSEQIYVDAAFTAKGKMAIDNFIEDLKVDLTIAKAEEFDRQVATFKQWYYIGYFTAWEEFAERFNEGQQLLMTGQDWRLMSLKVVESLSPYFALLQRMASELTVLSLQDDIPAWAVQVFRHQDLSASVSATQDEEKSLIGEAVDKGKELISQGRQAVDRVKGHPWERVKAINSYREMRQALVAISKKTAASKAVYDATAQVYNEDSVTGESPFYLAYRALLALQKHMGREPQQEKIFWQLLAGPLDFLWHYFQVETSCYLQDLWDAEVLQKISRVSSDRQEWEMLFRNPGFAMNFVEGPAKPFYQQGQKKRENYFYDKPFPFKPTLFSMMEKAQLPPPVAQSSYLIFIKGLPADLNKGARLNLHATHLLIPCANENLILATESFPTRATPFTWYPETCGEVNMRIEFQNNFVLEKTYSFPELIKIFEDGQAIYRPKDFPAERNVLERSGIDLIKVKYQLSGKKLKTIKALSEWSLGTIPRDIGQCWD